ncbi:MAG: FmdB family zinc ribbon protein, partial [Bacteroidota bacterium]
MPTYEYRREDGSTFEVFQRMSDDPLTVDPETGQKVTRVIGGGAGLIFKGDGFYLTDYARKGDGSKAKSAAAKTDAATETKSVSDTSSS